MNSLGSGPSFKQARFLSPVMDNLLVTHEGASWASMQKISTVWFLLSLTYGGERRVSDPHKRADAVIMHRMARVGLSMQHLLTRYPKLRAEQLAEQTIVRSLTLCLINAGVRPASGTLGTGQRLTQAKWLATLWRRGDSRRR